MCHILIFNPAVGPGKVTHLLSQVTRMESTLTRRESIRTQLLTAAIHAMPDSHAEKHE